MDVVRHTHTMIPFRPDGEGMAASTNSVVFARHSRLCRVCRSPHREAIEQEYVAWESPALICRRYRISSRSTLQTHVRALHLDEKRDGNIRRALASFIERGMRVKVTAAAFISAIATMSKLNEAGNWVDTMEQRGKVGNPLFEKMSKKELLRFAETGALPEWVSEEERASLG